MMPRSQPASVGVPDFPAPFQQFVTAPAVLLAGKRTRGFETKAANIECLGRNIRNPRAHAPLPRQLPASCAQYHGKQDGVTILGRFRTFRTQK